MPIYEYECGVCHLRFELRRHFNEDGAVFCPQCQGEAHRIFSPVPLIFKGSGFYITDSRKRPPEPGKKETEKPKNEAKKEKSETDNLKKEAKSEKSEPEKK